jgi:predicted flavoprotein YhiN
VPNSSFKLLVVNPVMHDKSKPLSQILSSYPRGNKELRGMYTKRFTPIDTYNWFTTRGVQLKTESDGRMFPITDKSETIIDAISTAAVKAGVCLRIKEKVETVKLTKDSETNHRFAVQLSVKTQSNDKVTKDEIFDSVILATGSFQPGHEIARSLGHTIVTPVPSLFTFDSKELVKEGGLFNELAGVSVPLARITLKVTGDMHPSSYEPTGNETGQPDQKISKKKNGRGGKKANSIVQEGPLLIT